MYAPKRKVVLVIHIPDMSKHGFAEFTRSYLQSFDCDGLIIDVRYNGGGNVSSLILQHLALKRFGLDSVRWLGANLSYPISSPKGNMVARNEQAGSDGDMFSYAFKAMKLGPLIGKRTWGGVIGISSIAYLMVVHLNQNMLYGFLALAMALKIMS